MARILVIDDDDQVRRMLRMMLETKGHEVLEANNGKEGLRLHRTTHPELAITDMLMPEMDGVELMLALRSEAPQLKIIAMSGGGRYKQTEALDVAGPLGAFATIAKPFGFDAMLDLVTRALAA